MFYTGQTKADPLLAEWSGRKVLAKPAEPALIVDAIARLLNRTRVSDSGRESLIS